MAGKGRRCHQQGDGSDRDVDVEDPPPTEVVHEDATDERTHHRGHPEHGHEETHVTPPFAGRDHVADDGHGTDHQTAAAQALDRPEQDELEHRLAQTGEHRPHQEKDDGPLEEQLASVEVAELAP